MIGFVRAWWKRTAVAGGAVLVTLLFVSMFATELTRAVVTTRVRPPLTLPPGVDIRHSDRLASVLGRGTPTGRATAITLGYVIIVPTSFHGLPLPRQQEVIGHELVHVRQRARYGRLYLPLYGALYVLRGYVDHPLEREARQY